MITITIHGPHCASDALVRNGWAPTASRNISAVPVIDKAEKIRLRMPTSTNAVRKSCEPMKSGAVCAGWSGHVECHATRSSHGSKKAAELAPLSETVMAPDATNPASTLLELDELWSCIANKTNQAWIWIALCRKSRQVVAYAIGDRNQATCHRVWEAIPLVYRTGHCFTDFWGEYQAVITEEQHTAVGKETGETAHVERWNNTLRQRLARFVRKTLSCSKSLVLHEACLNLFLHRYNLGRSSMLL